jgi:hypothetical protein
MNACLLALSALLFFRDSYVCLLVVLSHVQLDEDRQANSDGSSSTNSSWYRRSTHISQVDLNYKLKARQSQRRSRSQTTSSNSNNNNKKANIPFPGWTRESLWKQTYKKNKQEAAFAVVRSFVRSSCLLAVLLLSNSRKFNQSRINNSKRNS